LNIELRKKYRIVLAKKLDYFEGDNPLLSETVESVELSDRELEILIDAIMDWYDPDFQYHTIEEYNTLIEKLLKIQRAYTEPIL